jgi:hypothetical protein
VTTYSCQQFLHHFADHLPVGLALQLGHVLAHHFAGVLRPFRADFGDDLLRGGSNFLMAHLFGQVAQHYVEFRLVVPDALRRRRTGRARPRFADVVQVELSEV